MNWMRNHNKVGVTANVVVQLNNKQYLAGSFIRNLQGCIVFQSSDGAWTVGTKDIKRYLILE